MSSISSAERKSHTDDLRAQREESENRETETAKRHKKEVKRLLERQAKEVDSLKETYEKQIDTLRSRGNEQLSERDQENQAKIAELKTMYLESLRKKTSEAEQRRQAEADSYQGQIKKERQVGQQQRENLTRNFEDSIKERDRQFQDLTTQSRDDMKEAIERQGERQANKHQKEMRHVIEDRDNSQAQSQRDLKNSKSMYENRLRDQERNTSYQLDQKENSWRNTYDNKTKEMSELVAGKGEELKMARDHMQVRYNKALEEKLGALDGAHQILKDQTSARIDRDVRSLENENNRLQNDHMVEMMTTKRMRDLERKHVVQDYEVRMDNLAKTKDGLVEVGKEVNRRKIEQAVKKNNEILSETNRRNHTEMIIANERHREDRDRLEIEHKSSIRSMGDKSKERIEKVMRNTADAQRAERKQHNDNVGALRNSYSEELSNQRQAQMEQLKETYLRMDEKVKNTEEKLGRKLDETVNNYENRLAEVKEKHQQEMARLEQTYAAKTKDREKAHQMDIKTADIKTNMRLEQQQSLHEKEIERLDKRHQEQMVALAQKLNYYRKNS